MNFKVNIFKQIMKNDIIKTIYKGRRNFMKIGLVLEGGAMRGLFTAGVLDIFLDNNVEVTDVAVSYTHLLVGIIKSKKKA